MDIVKKAQLEKWENAIEAALSQILELQPDLEGFAHTAGSPGMSISVESAFEGIQKSVAELTEQLSLMEDFFEDDGAEVARLAPGKFVIVEPGVDDD
jgi:hypothetical protein